MDLEGIGQRVLMVGGYHQLLKESVYPAGRFSGSFCTANGFRDLPIRKFIKHLLAWYKRLIQIVRLELIQRVTVSSNT